MLKPFWSPIALLLFSIIAHTIAHTHTHNSTHTLTRTLFRRRHMRYYRLPLPPSLPPRPYFKENNSNHHILPCLNERDLNDQTERRLNNFLSSLIDCLTGAARKNERACSAAILTLKNQNMSQNFDH